MKFLASSVVVAACIAAGWIGIASRMVHAAPSPDHLATSSEISYQREPFDSALRDSNVENHLGMVKRDPKGAIGWAMLSGAYLARSRERDTYSDAVASEGAARKSLSLRIEGNLGGQANLVNSLLQEHKFLDALAATEKAVKLWGTEPTLTELHADILIEVGRYDDAKKIIDINGPSFQYPSGKAVMAHLAMVQGKPNEALLWLRSAYDEVNANFDAPADTVAWFQEKIGECLFSIGDTDQAVVAFDKTIALYPNDYKANGFLCRIAVGRGDWRSAIKFGDESDRIAPMADILALVGDSKQKLGDHVGAEKAYRDVVALAGKPSGPSDGLHEFAGAAGGHGHTLDRQYAMYCADHDRDLDGGYACAIRELQARRDIYAFDTLAWICYRRGDVAEAKQAIDRALAQHTQDAQMLYHAGRIYEANKLNPQAVTFYRKALATNPTFNMTEATDAQQQCQVVANDTKS